MLTEDRASKAVADCLFRAYTSALTRILRIMGVDDTVAMLRANADALEAAKPRLEAARKPRVQA